VLVVRVLVVVVDVARNSLPFFDDLVSVCVEDWDRQNGRQMARQMNARNILCLQVLRREGISGSYTTRFT